MMIIISAPTIKKCFEQAEKDGVCFDDMTLVTLKRHTIQGVDYKYTEWCLTATKYT